MDLLNFQCKKCGYILADQPATPELAKLVEAHRPGPKCGGELTQIPPIPKGQYSGRQ